jgi:tetratricopeptide (TPR) repeat protein
MPLLTAIITSDEYSVTHTPLWSTEEETSFASDVYLVDRQLEHQKCNQQLAMRQHLCLTGRQSSGKTSLARVLCAKHSTSYEHILWVDVVCISSIRHLLQILAEFLSWHGNPNLENQLSKDFSDEYGMKLKSLMSKAISWIHPTKNPFVLVFDHVDSVESESDLATFFKSLVSHSPKTSYIIFTSQSQPNWLDTNAEVCLPEQVSRNEARTMLMVHASNLTDAQIDRVLQASGGNIRALVQAARGIVNRKINPDTVTSSDIAWLNEGLLRDEDTSLTPTERAVLFAIAVLEDVADKTAIYDAIAGMLGHNSLDNDLVRLTKRRYITRTQTRISNFGRTSSIETCYHQVSPVEHSFYYNHEQLGATARRELHRRAAHYYQKTGNIALAALHFDRAGDYSTAINIITAPLRPNDSVNRSITWGSIHSAFWEIIHRGEEKLITQLLELYKEGSGTEGSYRKSFLREDQIIALYLTLGQLYLQKGDLAEARRSFEYTNRYLQHMEQSSERQNKLAFTSYLLAESWEHENPKQALDYIEQCLKFADNLASTVIADLYYKRASILLAQSEYTDSIEAVSIGMKYDNNDLSRQHQRAGAFLKL